MKNFTGHFNIINIIFLIIFLFPAITLFSQEKRNNCIECHSELDEEETSPTVEFKNDIHNASGILCSDCHGGDPEIDAEDDQYLAMDPKKGFKIAPKHNEVPEFCARCHSDIEYMRKFNPNIRVDQHENYLTSEHGKSLAKGDDKVANCVSCHKAHGIKSKSDPASTVYATKVPETCGKCHSDPEYMEKYNLPTDQLKEYKESTHGINLIENGDLSAPACNDCHGNHGAAPPGIESVHNVCGVCHPGNDQLFSNSSHKNYFDEFDFPECASCHNNHLIKKLSEASLGLGEQSVCENCHSEEDEGGKIAVEMKNIIENFAALRDSSRILCAIAEEKGMYVTEIKYLMNNVDTELLKARNTIHSFSFEEVKKITDEGIKLTLEVMKMENDALREYQKRRIGLAIFLFFILLTATALYLKIKEIDKRRLE